MASNASTRAGPGHLDATTARTVVFCHACHNEWYEDEHGQESCPRCASEIIEIVGLPHIALAYLKLLGANCNMHNRSRSIMTLESYITKTIYRARPPKCRRDRMPKTPIPRRPI